MVTQAGTSKKSAKDKYAYGKFPTSIQAPVPAGANTSNPHADLVAVDCPVVATCVAVGSYKPQAGGFKGYAVRTTSNGGWAATSLPVGPDAAANPAVTLTDVSCSTAAFCAAVGDYTTTTGDIRPLLLTYATGTWTASSPDLPAGGAYGTQHPLQAVSCPVDGSCAAVGSYSDSSSGGVLPLLSTLSAGTWTSTTAPYPAGGTGLLLKSIDCAGAGDCAAVGTYYGDHGYTGYIAQQVSGGSWADVTAPLPAQGDSNQPEQTLQSVSCPTTTYCLAGGTFYQTGAHKFGMLATYSSGSWTAATVAAPTGANQTDPYMDVTRVSCSAPTECAGVSDVVLASGAYAGALVTVHGAVTTTLLPLQGAAANPFVHTRDVACASATQCSATADFTDTAGHQRPTYAAQGSGTAWTGARAPLPPDANGSADAKLVAVAADSGSTAVAVGAYNTAGSSKDFGMITFYLPL